MAVRRKKNNALYFFLGVNTFLLDITIISWLRPIVILKKKNSKLIHAVLCK